MLRSVQLGRDVPIETRNSESDHLMQSYRQSKTNPLEWCLDNHVRSVFIHRVDQDQEMKNGSTKAMPKKQAGIQIDVDVCWDGNCDIMLQATFTKSAKVTFGVKHIKLSGRMSILLSPLTTELPVISAIQYGFTNPPDIQMGYSGMVSAFR